MLLTAALLGAPMAAALLASPPAAAQELKLEGNVNKPKQVDQKLKEKRARDALLGYYEALIKGQYDQAGSFAHPDAIEPVRKKLVELIQRAPTAKARSTLQNLGASDLTSLQSQTTAQFFANYARSTYAKNLQALAKPELKSRVEVTKVRCDPSRSLCEVTFDLIHTQQGQEVRGTNMARVADVDGRWLVGEGFGK